MNVSNERCSLLGVWPSMMWAVFPGWRITSFNKHHNHESQVINCFVLLCSQVDGLKELSANQCVYSSSYKKR